MMMMTIIIRIIELKRKLGKNKYSKILTHEVVSLSFSHGTFLCEFKIHIIFQVLFVLLKITIY